MYATADQFGVFYERNGLMRGYILSVVAVAIVCAVVRSLLDEKSSTGQILKMLSGILMTVTVVAPLANITFDNITGYLNGISVDANEYATEGKADARAEINKIIKSRTEAYILDKAASMGLEIAVEVELDGSNDSIPCGVTISGAVSPYAKQVLGAYIADNLGVSKENQRWI